MENQHCFHHRVFLLYYSVSLFIATFYRVSSVQSCIMSENAQILYQNQLILFFGNFFFVFNFISIRIQLASSNYTKQSMESNSFDFKLQIIHTSDIYSAFNFEKQMCSRISSCVNVRLTLSEAECFFLLHRRSVMLYIHVFGR